VEKIKRILVSQPTPQDIDKSPYSDLINRYGLKIDFFKFFKIVGISAKEFRQQRINLNDYTAIIMTSKNAVDHFFKLSDELRTPIADTVKFFCASEAIALYLQKYVLYRKRKVFAGKTNFCDLLEIIKKHRCNKFLLPCTEMHQQAIPTMLEKEEIDFDKAVIYRTESENLKNIDLQKYHLLAFFSPAGIKSLFENFPTFKLNKTIIAVFGEATQKEAKKNGLKNLIIAPTKEAPSMTMAIENYLDSISKGKKKTTKSVNPTPIKTKTKKTDTKKPKEKTSTPTSKAKKQN